MLRLAVLGLVALAGCRVHAGGSDEGASDPAPPSSERRESQSPHRVGDVVEVGEIHVNTVRARIIYAEEVHARLADVGRIVRVKDGRKRWGEGKVEGPSIEADVVSAKKIDADYIEAAEIHAKRVRIGR